MKEKLMGALGSFGMIIWFLLSFLFFAAPIIVLRWHFLITVVVYLLFSFVPTIATIISTGIWCYALYVTIKGPQDVIAIIFYIFFALFFIAFILPMITTFFSRKG